MIAAIAGLGGLLFGYDTGVIAGALLFIDPDFGLSSFESGVIVAAVPIGAVLGAALAGRLSDRFGRRAVILGSALVFGVGALGSAAAAAMSSSCSARPRRPRRRDRPRLGDGARLHLRARATGASGAAGDLLPARGHDRHRRRLRGRARLRPDRGLALDARPRRRTGPGARDRDADHAPEPPLAGDGAAAKTRRGGPGARFARAARTRRRGDRPRSRRACAPRARGLARPAGTDGARGARRRRRARDPATGLGHQHGDLLRADDHQVHRDRVVGRGDPGHDRGRARQRRR